MNDMTPIGKPNCWKNHLGLLAGFTVLLVGFAMTMIDRQQAIAERQDIRVRAVEQGSAVTQAKLDAALESLRRLEAKLDSRPVAAKP